MNDFFDARTKACKKLEAAESKVIRTATLEWRRRVKLHKKAEKKVKQTDEEKLENGTMEPLKRPEVLTHEFLDDLVPYAKRPKHRTGVLGLVGKKVDTVDWCKVI